MNDDEASSLITPIMQQHHHQQQQQQQQQQQKEQQEEVKESPTSREFDGFFCKLYALYYHRGLVPICLFEVTGLFNLLFIGGVTSWLCFVDYAKVMAGCGEPDATCELRNYISGDLFSFSPMYRLLTLSYVLLFAAFFLYRCAEATSTVLDALYIANFCRETLGLRKAGEFEELPWSDIVELVMELHRQGLCLINSKPCIDALEITGRIMRKQNYLIALINRDVLDLKVPWYLSLLLHADKVHLTQSLEWSINYCLLDVMHNDCLNLSAAFLKDKDGSLARAFVLVGVVNLLLTPFILVLMTMQFFLSNAQQSCSSHLLSRRWTSLALWKFREFNELPHVFEQRMRESSEASSQYIQCCSRSQNLTIIFKCLQFISGSFVALLLLCSVLKEEALIFIHLGSHNLLWWLGLFSSIYVASRAYTRGDGDDEADQAATTHCGTRSYAFFPAQHHGARSSRADALIEKICSHTHYYPKRWRTDAGAGASRLEISARSALVRDDLDALFPQKIYIFAYEVLSVVLTPVILCCSLPPCAPRIIAFIKRHTTYLPGMGAVLDYSLFDFDKYAPCCAGAPEEGASAAVGAAFDSAAPAPPDSDSDSPTDPAADLKLEQSYLSFRQSYPQWGGQQGSLRGETLIDRVASFREGRERERETEEHMFYSCELAQSAHAAHAGLVSRPLGAGPASSHARLTQSVQLTRSRMWGAGWDGGDSQQQRQHSQGPAGEGDLRKILLSVLAAENIDFENDFYWLNLFQRDAQRETNPPFVSL